MTVSKVVASIPGEASVGRRVDSISNASTSVNSGRDNLVGIRRSNERWDQRALSMTSAISLRTRELYFGAGKTSDPFQ